MALVSGVWLGAAISVADVLGSIEGLLTDCSVKTTGSGARATSRAFLGLPRDHPPHAGHEGIPTGVLGPSSPRTCHAAGPQGREGLRAILKTIDEDLGPVTLEQHHLIGEGDLVAQHLTLQGTHRASSRPLLADLPVAGRQATGPSSTSGGWSTA